MRLATRTQRSVTAIRTLAAVVCLSGVSVLAAQQTTPVNRLPLNVLDVVPPSNRVTGAPGQMRVARAGCQAVGSPETPLRRRIVNVAVQEWAYFGLGISDQSVIAPERSEPLTPSAERSPRTANRRGRARIPPTEAARVASSIAGYWTVTPEGAWIIDRQNETWNSEAGIGARWQSPWSAAFISWVMCESGLSDTDVFHRAVAHHRYIDQAIRARDGQAPRASYVAYDAGETPIAPGDLLCSGRRPAYRTLAERRRQMGEGASTHCDIVVKIDPVGRRILAIGGNVRSSVTLKVIPGQLDREGRVRPLDFSSIELDDNPYRGARPIFAHLKLRADAGPADALDRSPTIRALTCTTAAAIPARVGDLLSSFDPTSVDCQ